MNTHEMIVPLEIEDLETVRIPFNYVLMEYFPRANEKTISGIYVPESSAIEADNIDRVGIAIKVAGGINCYYRAPKNATPKQKQHEMESMRWKTNIEVQEGDKLIVNFQGSANAYQFTYGDRYFKGIHYQDIVMAIRGEEVIMCNGYVLLEEITESSKFLDYEKKEPVMGRGVVAYFGTPNQEYNVKEGDSYRYDDPNVILSKGDVAVVLKNHWAKVRYLEDATHQVFDSGKKLLVVQRYMIGFLL